MIIKRFHISLTYKNKEHDDCSLQSTQVTENYDAKSLLTWASNIVNDLVEKEYTDIIILDIATIFLNT